MPPQRLFRHFPYISSSIVSRGVKSVVLAATLVLAGCATNANKQLAETNPSRIARDNYLSHIQSDPLGAYLSNQEQAYSTPPKTTRALASTALSVLGIKYRYGGEAPNTGFDCSGLVIYAAEKSLGLKLPRRSAEIAREGISVKRDELKRGDLVFFNTRGRRFSHVGIYLGDRKFVHAPRKGAVVRIEDMDIAYWKKRYNGARRLAANKATDTLSTN
ncbi:MAG TPA: C40 family peptidase [Burkholderiaceae bacterium]|nr:C40 family peptidase [Burkholderiaceae bacterium]